MSDISVIGLGSMGGALARALQRSGHRMTVWNRTPARMQAFAEQGAEIADTVASAIRASPAILVCVDDYAVTSLLLETDAVIPHLRGRTVIQLSTGTPQQARESEKRLAGWGAAYLDGAILCGPSSIGTPRATIVVGGAESAFQACEPVLRSLAGDLRYLGDNIAAASALDLAWLCEIFGVIVGVCHGARICESEKVPLDLYATLFDETDIARHWAQIIHRRAFADPGATLKVWHRALRRIQEQAGDAGIGSAVPDFIGQVLARAEAHGLGEEDVTAIVKVL